MKTCDGTVLLSEETMSCTTEEYICVDNYVDGTDVYVDVTYDEYPTEVSWEFYESDGTQVSFYDNDGNSVTNGACQYVKSVTGTCTSYDSNSASCASRRLSSNKNFTSLSGPNFRQTQKKDLSRNSARSRDDVGKNAKSRSKKIKSSSGPIPRPRKKRNLSRKSSKSYNDVGESFEYSIPTREYVVRKYYDIMEPIFCVKNSTVAEEVGTYCWVDGRTTIDDDARYGGFLFPIIQHRDPSCSWCKKGSYSKKKCNTFDMEFVLLFNAVDPSKPYYAKFNNSNHYHYDFGSVSAEDHPDISYTWTKSGFTGFIKINLYGGVKYLNELLYTLPDTQCTEPITIAQLSTSALACGKTNARKVLKKGGGQNKVCQVPPTSPVQDFLECSNRKSTCLSTALAASVAFIQLLLFVAISFLGTVGGKYMNKFAVPLDEEGKVMAKFEDETMFNDVDDKDK